MESTKVEAESDRETKPRKVKKKKVPRIVEEGGE